MNRRKRSLGALGLVLVVISVTAGSCENGRPITVTGLEPVQVQASDERELSGFAPMVRENARFELPAGAASTVKITIESLGEYGGKTCRLSLGGEFEFTLTEVRAPSGPAPARVPGTFTGVFPMPALAPGQSATATLECDEASGQYGERAVDFDIVTSRTAAVTPTPTPTPSRTAAASTAVPANTPVSTDQFSIGLAPEVTGTPGVAAGYIRLWDMATAWKDVNPSPGVFNWTVLDQRVAQTQASGAKVLYVAGLTPSWAASGGDCDPRWGAASCTPPADPTTYSNYITAVMQRYGGAIGAVEVWNEANLRTFWSGSAEQMADLTQRASQAVKAVSPGTVVLAASSTTRLTGPVRTFFGPYAAALKTRGYPIDAWSIHSYPAGDAGPAGRSAGITTWKAQLATSTGNDPAAMRKGIWDTEINYGLAGPGATPGTAFGPEDGAAILARTYVDSVRLGIGSTFWYLWTAGPYSLVGIQLHTGTTATIAAYNQARSWLGGTTFKGCDETATKVVRCYFTKDGGDAFYLAMTASGAPVGYRAGSIAGEGVLGEQYPAGAIVQVGQGPVKFTCGAAVNPSLCRLG